MMRGEIRRFSPEQARPSRAEAFAELQALLETKLQPAEDRLRELKAEVADLPWYDLTRRPERQAKQQEIAALEKQVEAWSKRKDELTDTALPPEETLAAMRQYDVKKNTPVPDRREDENRAA